VPVEFDNLFPRAVCRLPRSRKCDVLVVLPFDLTFEASVYIAAVNPPSQDAPQPVEHTPPERKRYAGVGISFARSQDDSLLVFDLTPGGGAEATGLLQVESLHLLQPRLAGPAPRVCAGWRRGTELRQQGCRRKMGRYSEMQRLDCL
jgi:hypothetical protein